MSTHVYLATKKRKPRRKITAISRQQLETKQVPGYEEGVMLDSQHLLISALLPPTVKGTSSYLPTLTKAVEQVDQLSVLSL